MMLRVILAGSSMASVPMIATVYAAEKATDTATDDKISDTLDVKPKQKKKDNIIPVRNDNTIFVNQLPLYGEPVPAQLVYTAEKVGVVQENVVPIREVLLTTINKCEKFINFASKTEETVSATLKDFARYLREDSGAVPRGVFITVSGLGGLIAGYRGGVFRKTLFMTMGLTGSSAVCYPQQAIDLSKQGWILTKDQAIELWNQTKTTSDKVTEKPAESKPKLDDKNTVQIVDKSDSQQSEKTKEDHGMSKLEDKAMYSTRS